MNEYVYGWGARKHIASSTPGVGKNVYASLCGHWFQNEAGLRERLGRWNHGFVYERQVQRHLDMPVCKICKARAS